MKKLLLFLLLISSFANAQEELGLNKYAQKWAVACSVYPLPRTFAAINLFINSENNNGNWAKYDRCWVLGVGLASSALVDIVNGNTSAVAVNSPTFTAYQGYAGNGTSSYINTGYNPTLVAVNFTLNSASFGIYARTVALQNKYEFGGLSPDNFRNYLQVLYTTNQGQMAVNCSTGGSSFLNFTNSGTQTGFFVAIRTASNALAVWKNGSSIASSAQASSAISNAVFAIDNADGGISTNQISFADITSGGVGVANQNTSVHILKNLLQW